MGQLHVLDQEVVRLIMDRILQGREGSYTSMARALEEVVAPCTDDGPVVCIRLDSCSGMLARALTGCASESDGAGRIGSGAAGL